MHSVGLCSTLNPFILETHHQAVVHVGINIVVTTCST